MKKPAITPPLLDPRIQFVGVAHLRRMDAPALRELKDGVIVLQKGGERLAVLISYDAYRLLQKAVGL